MDILAFLILVFLFFYFVSWEVILILIIYVVIMIICVGILDALHKLHDAIGCLTFVFVTVMYIVGTCGFYEYKKWKLIQEMQGKEVFLWMVKDKVHDQKPYSVSYSSGSASKKNTGNSSNSYTSDFYDDGYEAGYEDGIHRDHGAHMDSEDYEYEDGYSQGYYDAVHDDEDWEDDESEDW